MPVSEMLPRDALFDGSGLCAGADRGSLGCAFRRIGCLGGRDLSGLVSV